MTVSHSHDGLVRIATRETGKLVPALLQLNASVLVRGHEIEVRGLSARQVALVAAVQLAAVTDLTTENR